MDDSYLDSIRAKLERRVDRLGQCGHRGYDSGVARLLSFITEQPILAGIVSNVHRDRPHGAENARVYLGDGKQQLPDGDEREYVAFAAEVLAACTSDTGRPVSIGQRLCPRTENGMRKDPPPRDKYTAYHQTTVLPLCDYLIEQLDDQRLVLDFLRRYKQKCEWFGRSRLNDLEGDELKLQPHLYEYLHDQGFELYLDPSSASGEPDLVMQQTGNRRLIVEVKVFDAARKGKDHICRGFGQTYRYVLDYNEPFGALVIFNVSDKDIRFAVPDRSGLAPCVELNGKLLSLVVIDIAENPPSASKRGRLDVVEITERDLIRTISEPDAQELPAHVGPAASASV